MTTTTTANFRMDLLRPLDQRAVREAANGERWAIERLQEMLPIYAYVADILLRRYFNTDYTTVTGGTLAESIIAHRQQYGY